MNKTIIRCIMWFIHIFCLVVPRMFADSPWPMFRHDAFRTGRSPYVGSQTNDLQWRYQMEEWVISSPAVGSDGTIYVGSCDFYVYALNPDGTLKWRYETGNVIHSSPAIGDDGTIFVGGYNNYLYAINPDGTLKWRYQTEGAVYSSPAIGDDGTIFVGSFDNYLYAINPDGTLKWRHQTGGEVWSSPAVGSDGTIYIGSFDMYLYAIGGPTITPTPLPTDTPAPSTTNTPTPVPPTATPSCEVLGCTLDLPSHLYHPGDMFYANVEVCNPDATDYGLRCLFVLLDVYGNYYYAPSFSTDVDYYEIDVAPGTRQFEVVPAFEWPPDVGEASGIYFYAAMTDTGITDIFGEMDIFEFGWTE